MKTISTHLVGATLAASLRRSHTVSPFSSLLLYMDVERPGLTRLPQVHPLTLRLASNEHVNYHHHHEPQYTPHCHPQRVPLLSTCEVTNQSSPARTPDHVSHCSLTASLQCPVVMTDTYCCSPWALNTSPVW